MVKYLLCAACVMMACDSGFPEETLVENLRVLGIRSTPADLHPGESAVMQSLILDPRLGSKKPSILWVGCQPDPYNLNRSPCSDPAVLSDPASLAAPDGGLPEGVKIIGLNDQASYPTDVNLFSNLPAGDARRVTGTAGLVLAVAVAEEVSILATQEQLRAVFARVQSKELDSLIALFRIRISEDPQRNSNPVFRALTIDGEMLPAGATLAVKPDQKLTLDIEVADEVFEPYTASTPAGGVAQKTERILAAWYSSTGRYSEKSTTLREGVHTVLTAPGVLNKSNPVPSRRTGTIYVTLRDTRGGQTWQTFPLYVCDEMLPEPVVSRVTSEPNEPLVVMGENLEQLLDVVINGAALKGSYNPSSRQWVANAPVLLAGTYPVAVTTKRCGKIAASLDVQR